MSSAGLLLYVRLSWLDRPAAFAKGGHPHGGGASGLHHEVIDWGPQPPEKGGSARGEGVPQHDRAGSIVG